MFFCAICPSEAARVVLSKEAASVVKISIPPSCLTTLRCVFEEDSEIPSSCSSGDQYQFIIFIRVVQQIFRLDWWAWTRR